MLPYFSTLASNDTELLLTFQQNLKKAHKIKQTVIPGKHDIIAYLILNIKYV